MQRPTSVVVFGVLNLVFGALGLLGTLISAAMFVMPQQGGFKNPVLELVNTNPTYAAFLKVSLVLGLVASVVVLLAGVGLLMSKAWGRTLSLVYAFYAIVAGVVGVVVNYSTLCSRRSCSRWPRCRPARKRARRWAAQSVGSLEGASG